MNHKWLAGDAKEQLSDAFAPEILAVPTTTPDESAASAPTEKKSDDQPTDEMPPQASDEDKENSVCNSDNVDKSPSMTINHNSPPSIVNAKLVLEKSLSISLFPDAPTTPKVSRKMVFEDEDDLNTQVKEIVKKYQTSESQPQPPPQAFPCCERESSGICMFCNPQKAPVKPPSLELDKGIIC